MTGRIYLIIAIVIAHLFGLVMFAVNVFYLKLTRGYDPKRRYTENEDLDVLKSKRCCKIRNGRAMTMLVIYHVALEIIDFIIVFISESNRDSEYVLEWPLHWLLPGLHYAVIFCFMPAAMILGASTFAHIGPINAFNAYEFLHLVIFWYAIFFMIICAGIGRENLAPDLRDLAAGYAAIPMAFSYLIMLFGAWNNRSCYHVEEDVISSHEAVRTIKELLEKTISIEITISCGHTTSNRRTTHYYELHSETQRYTFDSDNIRRILKPEHLSEGMFKKKYTKLTVMDEIKPGDLFEMNKLERSKGLLRMKHKGHDDERRLSMKTGSESRYLVQNDGIEPMPAMFSCGRYWTFACLGLSLPYRWYLYCSVGHLKYKIVRKVYSQSANISNEPVDFEPEVLQPTGPSVQTYGHYTPPPRHEARYDPVPQPVPYSSPSHYDSDTRESVERFQPRPSTPPPGYREACFMISGSAEGLHSTELGDHTRETLV